MQLTKLDFKDVSLEQDLMNTNHFYHKILYSQKLDNTPIEEFLIVYHIPKLNPEDINSLNRTTKRNEIKTVIKSFASWKSPEGDRVLNSIKISGKISSNSS